MPHGLVEPVLGATVDDDVVGAPPALAAEQRGADLGLAGGRAQPELGTGDEAAHDRLVEGLQVALRPGGTGAGTFYDFMHLVGDAFAREGFTAQIYPLVLMRRARISSVSFRSA